MERGDLKAGQLLGIVEKRGKLLREYIAGFFGDEPIIKQRMLTPQEARRYREDLARGKKAGKSESEAVRSASEAQIEGGANKRLVKKKKRRIVKPGTEREQAASAAANDVAVSAEGASINKGVPTATEKQEPEMEYLPEQAADNRNFVKELVASESDKTNFIPENTQKAINAINKLGSPDMKIFRIGKMADDKEGDFYTQKEYIARKELGLPLWKQTPEKTEPTDTPPAT